MIEIIAIFTAGFYFLSLNQFILFILLVGIGEGRCGWFMHEGGHYSLTGSYFQLYSVFWNQLLAFENLVGKGVIAIDRTIQTIFYGVGCGMSAGWWRVQHNKHHSMPQKLGHDVDLDTLPLVAFTEKVPHLLPFHFFSSAFRFKVEIIFVWNSIEITKFLWKIIVNK